MKVTRVSEITKVTTTLHPPHPACIAATRHTRRVFLALRHAYALQEEDPWPVACPWALRSGSVLCVAPRLAGCALRQTT